LDRRAKAEKYATQSLRYLKNASRSIDEGNSEKAGEFLWGSIAEALKAIAASQGIELRAHWEIGNYAKELTKRLGDKDIFNAFGHASYLHSNFYEAGLGIADVKIYAQEIRATVGKLLSLIPQKEQGS